MNILQVNSSARIEGSHSTTLANSLVERIRADNPAATVTVRDLSRTPHLPLDESSLQALFTPADKRTPGQAARVALDDTLISEVQAADVVVLGVPMYNFGVPGQLKDWIDAISRAQVTFRYTASGPEGLLKGKKVYVALTRGGKYRNTPSRHAGPLPQDDLRVPRHDRRAVRLCGRAGDGAGGAAECARLGARADRRTGGRVTCTPLAATAH